MCPNTLEWKIQKEGGYIKRRLLAVKYSVDSSLNETTLTWSPATLFSDKGKHKHIISFGVLCHGDRVIGLFGRHSYMLLWHSLLILLLHQRLTILNTSDEIVIKVTVIWNCTEEEFSLYTTKCLKFINMGCTIPVHQFAMASILFMVSPNICGSSVMNLFHVTLLTRRTLRRFIDF